MRFSSVRHVRMRVYPWGGNASSGFMAVTDYAFGFSDHGGPCARCVAIPRLVRVTRSEGRLRAVANLFLDTNDHVSLQGVQLLDLDGDGVPELIVESDGAGGASHMSHLIVCSLARGRFDQWLRVESRFRHYSEEEYTQQFDAARTRDAKAARFCFIKTTYAAGNGALLSPSVSHPCYPRLTGVGSESNFHKSE